LKHRLEIDGLRTLAILPVLFYHAHFDFLSGGFLGVDIFFVISGYLITSLIYQEIKEKRFSLIHFYERRVRRIIPVLYLVLFIFSLIFYFTMLPWDYENFGAELVSTIFFGNNIFHYLTSGNYWGVETEFKSFIHTWSLGIEEQFYFIFSLLALALLNKNKLIIFIFLILIVLTSLILSLTNYKTNEMSVFYLLHFRAWELIVGSIIALAPNRINITRIKNELITFISLLFIFAGFYFARNTSLNPTAAIFVVTGTALLIFFTKNRCFLQSLLKSKIFVTIGLISYSAYLWHQPLFVLFRLNKVNEPLPYEYIPIILGTLVLSYFSWRYFENFFRFSSYLNRKKRYFIFFISTFILATIGLSIFLKSGLPERFQDLNINNKVKNANVEFNMSALKYKDILFDRNYKKNLLIIGDSFARDFINSGTVNGYFSSYNLSNINNISFCNYTKNIIDTNIQDIITNANYLLFVSSDNGRNCYDFKKIEKMFLKKQVYFIGIKDFGWSTLANLNKSGSMKSEFKVKIKSDIQNIHNDLNKKFSKSNNYVNLLKYYMDEKNMVRVFNDDGKLLSFDTKHLTREGALFLGKLWFNDINLSKFKH